VEHAFLYSASALLRVHYQSSSPKYIFLYRILVNTPRLFRRLVRRLTHSRNDGTLSAARRPARQCHRRWHAPAEKTVEWAGREHSGRRGRAVFCDGEDEHAAAAEPEWRRYIGSATTLSLHSPLQCADKAQKTDKTGRRTKRSPAQRTLSRFKRLCIRHTWLGPLVLTLLIVSLYLVYPYPSNPISACLFLSYPLPSNDPLIPADVRANSEAPTHYGKGGRDFAFVGFYIIVLSFTREFCMQSLIRPIAVYFGIKSRAKQSRFMEQAYTALYFGIYGPFGLWVMRRTPTWYFNTTAMYEGFPHRTNDGFVKAYYLLQASYWAQQLIVLLLMLEKPRKDFSQLVAHHIITITLIWCSFRFHFTYMGIAVYITHDISDFFLAVRALLTLPHLIMDATY
jgi:hypothetical protein